MFSPTDLIVPGNTHCRCRQRHQTYKLRKVGRVFPRVRLGSEQAAYGVAGPLDESAFTDRVISWIFFGHGRYERFGHVVLYGCVGKYAPIISAVSRAALPKRR